MPNGRNNLLMNFDKAQVNMSKEDLMTQEEWRQHRFDTSVWGKELPPHPPLAHFGKEPKDCIGLKLRPLKKVNNRVTPTVWGEVLGPPTDDSDENNVLMKFPAGEVNMSFADLTPTDPTDPKDPTEQDEVEDDSDSSSEDDSDDEDSDDGDDKKEEDDDKKKKEDDEKKKKKENEKKDINELTPKKKIKKQD